jgi:hypothetical protein
MLISAIIGGVEYVDLYRFPEIFSRFYTSTTLLF